MLTPHNQSRDQAKKEKAQRRISSDEIPDESDAAAASVCDISRKIPDWEWVPSDRRAENPGIRKEKDKFRLDSWIQIRKMR